MAHSIRFDQSFDIISDCVEDNKPIEEMDLGALSKSIQEVMAFQLLHPAEADSMNQKLQALFDKQHRIEAIYHIKPEKRGSIAEQREQWQKMLDRALETVHQARREVPARRDLKKR